MRAPFPGDVAKPPKTVYEARVAKDRVQSRNKPMFPHADPLLAPIELLRLNPPAFGNPKAKPFHSYNGEDTVKLFDCPWGWSGFTGRGRDRQPGLPQEPAGFRARCYDWRGFRPFHARIEVNPGVPPRFRLRPDRLILRTAGVRAVAITKPRDKPGREILGRVDQQAADVLRVRSSCLARASAPDEAA
jgi:hypothetical protein